MTNPIIFCSKFMFSKIATKQANHHSPLFVSLLVLRIRATGRVSSKHWNLSGTRIHGCTISLRFLGIIMIVLRLEVFVHNVYITNQFQTSFAQEGGGGGRGAKIR
jgi:hypothetical protein